VSSKGREGIIQSDFHPHHWDLNTHKQVGPGHLESFRLVERRLGNFERLAVEFDSHVEEGCIVGVYNIDEFNETVKLLCVCTPYPGHVDGISPADRLGIKSLTNGFAASLIEIADMDGRVLIAVIDSELNSPLIYFL
jgi:hypothetical protein